MPPAITDPLTWTVEKLDGQKEEKPTQVLMASTPFLHPATSSFRGQFPLVSAPSSARVPVRNGNGGLVSVRATGEIVLVEKSEAEKTHRLKTTYLEKIVPLLKEEFNYANIHQAISPFTFLLFIGYIWNKRTFGLQNSFGISYSSRFNWSLNLNFDLLRLQDSV